MSSPREIEAAEAEVTYCRESIALLRARLYRRGDASSPRLEELQRRLEGAERRLSFVRPTPPASPPPVSRP